MSMLENYANSGNVEAIRRLGNFYYDGVGVPKDDSVAIGWYRKGASLGDPWCKIRMGDMYRDGRGTERDPDEALRWYFESAAHGSIAAINSIIGMYTSGMIHNKDVYDKAISIFNNYTNSGNI